MPAWVDSLLRLPSFLEVHYAKRRQLSTAPPPYPPPPQRQPAPRPSPPRPRHRRRHQAQVVRAGLGVSGRIFPSTPEDSCDKKDNDKKVNNQTLSDVTTLREEPIATIKTKQAEAVVSRRWKRPAKFRFDVLLSSSSSSSSSSSLPPSRRRRQSRVPSSSSSSSFPRRQRANRVVKTPHSPRPA